MDLLIKECAGRIEAQIEKNFQKSVSLNTLKMKIYKFFKAISGRTFIEMSKNMSSYRS